VRRRSFLCTPLLLPTLALAAPARRPSPMPRSAAASNLAFPRDHGAHPDFRTEWWYVTGALDTPQADIGFQLTFFRSRPGIAEALRSPIAARQILFAHAALTHSRRAACCTPNAPRRANLGAGFSSTTATCISAPGGCSARSRARRASFASDAEPQFSYDLTLTPTQPLLLQGDGGYSRKGARARNWPAITSAGRSCRSPGSLVLDGQRQPASGRAWFDHEWSTACLATAPSAGTGSASTSTTVAR
jgi:predicted secreted hydrolase